MKPRHFTLIVLASLAAGSAQAGNITWADSAGNTAWVSGASWTGANSPADDITTDVAIVASVANAQPDLDVATRSVTGADFQLAAGGASFTSISGATLTLGANGLDATTQLSGTSTVSVETLKLGAASTWTLFSSTSNASTSTFSISSDIDLNGKNLTVRSNRNSASGNVGIVNLSGAISGNAAVTLESGSGSRNTFHLTGSSSYTGTTTIKQSTVTANSLANAGSNSAFGSSGTIILGNDPSFSTLTFQNLTTDGTTDRLLSLKGTSGGYTLRNNDADNTISFTNAGNTGDASISTATTLTLGGTNTGTNTFGQVINDRNGAGLTAITKADAGTWALTNSNTYSGGTTMSGGTLLISQDSSLGSGTVTFSAGATLGATTALTLANNINVGANTAILTNSSGNFILTGAVTGTGGVRKMGPGTLELNGANTFTGEKAVDNGAVSVSGNQSTSTGNWMLRGGGTGTTYNTAATTTTFESDATLAVASGKTVQLGNANVGGGFANQTLNANGSMANDGTLFVGRCGILNVVGAWSQNGTALVSTVGGGQAFMNVNAGGTFAYTSATEFLLRTSNSTSVLTRLTIDGGTFTTGVKVHNDTTTPASNTHSDLILTNGGTLKLSADVTDLVTTAGASTRFILNTGGGIVDTNGFSTTLNLPVTGTGGLTKAGAGSLTTTGTNTYTGNTTVNGGTLSLAGANLSDASSVTIATGALLNLNFTGSDTVASLTIGGTSLPGGTYNSTTHPAFITGTGQITVAGGANFTSWASGLSLTGNATADFDKDGLTDAAEYVLGTNPKASNTTGITMQKSGGNLTVTFSRADASETPDLTLFVEAGENLQAWPQVFQIGSSTANSSSGVQITENGASADTVVVTIPSNTAKRFARLKVVVSGS